MDRQFARCVDYIALQGIATPLRTAATHALGESPRPAQLRFLARAFRTRQHLFESPDWTAEPDELLIKACEKICRRALGYVQVEHPPLPEPAWQLFRHIGRAGPSGALQADLAKATGITAVMVSHYLGALWNRRLVARKKVVLTTTKPRATGQSRTTTNITYTSVIVLARYAKDIANADPKLEESDEPSAPAKSIAELNVDLCIERVLAALRVPPFVRTQRDLKVIAMPESERPSHFTKEVYQRRRHRAFRAVKVKLERMGIASVVDRHCVNAQGKPRGVLTCLKLNHVPGEEDVEEEAKMDDEALVVKMEEDFDEADGERRAENEWDENKDEGDASSLVHGLGNAAASTEDAISMAVDKVPDLQSQQQEEDTDDRMEIDTVRPRLLAEVDIVEQVYQLLHRAGSQGMSVPEISSYLDGGTGLTNTPQKRIRNIINGIKKIVPVVESQRFEGSAMHLKVCLAEFSDMNGVIPSARKTAVAQMSQPGDEAVASREKKSLLARKKNELTSLGLQRQELIVKLLQERKAMVIETLGREVARLENSGLHRVDQKVMRRIIGGLVAQRRASVITTAKPSIKESNRWQTIRLVVLPDLDESSPEVAQAISSLMARALYGDADGSHTPQKRKPESDEVVVTETELRQPRTPKESPKKLVSKDKPPRAPKRRKRAKPKEEGAEKEQPYSDVENADVEPTPVQVVNKKQTRARQKPSKSIDETLREAVVLQTEFRDSRKSSIWRLRAIDCGVLRGRMARIRLFHEKLYKLVVASALNQHPNPPPVQHSTEEVAKRAAPLGKFTILSCLKEFTIGEYAATVGLYQYREILPDALRSRKMEEEKDLMDKELQSNAASRQIQGLVQGLVRLHLLESTNDAQWRLCGAGTIRDFGKGMPAGVLPHGILFTSERAVDTYWKELAQFAHYRYVKSAWKSPQSDETQPPTDDPWAQPLSDVYMVARWKQEQQQTFTKKEQLQYEVMLQQLAGTEVDKAESGAVDTSNFIVTPLKRFSVEELFDGVHGKSSNPVPKKHAGRNPLNVEKLLFYSRFRGENDIPKDLCYAPDARDNASNPGTPAPHLSAEKPVLVMTLSKGVTSVETAMLRKESGAPRRRSSKQKIREYARDLRRQASSRKKSPSEFVLELERCVELIRGVVSRRAAFLCKKDVETAKWNVTMEIVRLQEGKSVPKNTDMTSTEDGEKQMRFQNAVITVCETALVRSVIEILALKLSIQLMDDHSDTADSCLEKCERLYQTNGSDLDQILRVAVTEAKQELYRNSCLVIQRTEHPELSSSQFRLNVLEQEFRLSANMRLRQGYSLGQQLAVLAERHRRIAQVQGKEKLRLGLIFGIKSIDGGWSSADDNTTNFRVDVMEQIVISILHEGRESLKSKEVLDLLSRFSHRDVSEARDRLLLRGVISVHEWATVPPHFALNDTEKTSNGVSSGGEVLCVKSAQEHDWKEELDKYAIAQVGDRCNLFRSTECGKAAFGRDVDRSMRAVMMSTQLAFCAEHEFPSLQLQPLARQAGSEADSVRGEAAGFEGESSIDDESGMKIDVEFSYRPGPAETSGGNSTSIDDGYNAKQDEDTRDIQEQVENEVCKQGQKGLLLSELLDSVIAAKCEDKAILVKAVYEMLKLGKAYRFSIESGNVSKRDRRLQGEDVLYVWHSCAEMLSAVQGESGGDEVYSVVSVWSTIRGEGRNDMLTNVSCAILREVGTRPGIREDEVLREIGRKFCYVPLQAVRDVMFALLRRGALRRISAQPNTSGGAFGAVRRRVEWGAAMGEWWEGFVDGEAIMGKRSGDAFLQACTRWGVDGNLTAADLIQIGKRLW